MWLIVGLGNPGEKYSHNRHNIGFMTVNKIVHRHSSFGAMQKKFGGLIAEGRIGNEKLVIIKPQTYMNKSGLCVSQVMQFYKLKPNQVWVFHDELALKAGQFRVKKGGGHGGHNGLRDISAAIGSDYGRIRMGIDHPGDKNRVSGYVLSNFTLSDKDWLNAMTKAAADYVDLLLMQDSETYMNKVALAVKPHLIANKENNNGV